MNDTHPRFNARWATWIGHLAVGLLLIGGPLVIAKLVVLPALGLRSGLAPTVAITAKPFEFMVTIATNVVIALGGYATYVRWMERRPADELALRWSAVFMGLASGIMFIGAPMLILYGAGYYTLEQLSGWHWETLAIVFIVGSIVLLEEVVFRGLIFGITERLYGLRTAMVVQAALFAAAHMFNDNWSGAMPLVSTFVIGLLWGAIYILSRSLWLISFHHAAWNLTIFSAGLPLSGITDWRVFAPLQSRLQGSEWLTGGLGGPEVSVLTPVFVVLLLGLLYRAVQRGYLPPPTR